MSAGVVMRTRSQSVLIGFNQKKSKRSGYRSRTCLYGNAVLSAYEDRPKLPKSQ